MFSFYIDKLCKWYVECQIIFMVVLILMFFTCRPIEINLFFESQFKRTVQTEF